MTCGSITARVSFAVIDLPATIVTPVDGVFAWNPVRKGVFLMTSTDSNPAMVKSFVEAAGSEFTLTNSFVKQAASWPKFRVLTNATTLMLEIPSRKKIGGTLVLDTGFTGGVILAPEQWRKWRAAHSDQPATFVAAYTPGIGLEVKEETWANKLAFGPMVLTDVPVMEAAPLRVKAALSSGALQYEATLGLAALERLDLIIDGPHDVVWFRAKKTPPPPYEHNRLGAVFAPPNLEAEDLFAHVAAASPAYRAGIRDGDVLLKIGELDATKWRTDPVVLPLTRFWNRPPGTQLELTLRRGQDTFKASVVLQPILPPATEPSTKTRHE
jgi:hypothetical protein